jgi:hypothetical protein
MLQLSAPRGLVLLYGEAALGAASLPSPIEWAIAQPAGDGHHQKADEDAHDPSRLPTVPPVMAGGQELLEPDGSSGSSQGGDDYSPPPRPAKHDPGGQNGHRDRRGNYNEGAKAIHCSSDPDRGNCRDQGHCGPNPFNPTHSSSFPRGYFWALLPGRGPAMKGLVTNYLGINLDFLNYK